ncbi:MAG TPA: radical SAM protein [Gemmatimonadaceae bacterium]|jgi:MoaA/NifB/PqqE/SkfB family radical SAM enzyme|nr:radical SAM protein [Gemmatimonadaceae bacterium]
MQTVDRVKRHVQLVQRNYDHDIGTPPFLVLFINSICNMKCEHCFYWTSLNKKDDLTYEELVALSKSMGHIENLNLSGGEPFLRKEFADVCRQFIRNNGVRQIYVPTNGYFTDRTIAALRSVLQEPSLDLFVIELSLDGMPEFHDNFRVARHSFEKSMQTYDALAALQQEDPRLRIHANSCATGINLAEIKQLTTFLYDRCPAMEHHNLAIIRGDRKNPSLNGPTLQQYEELYEYIRRLWAPRERSRYGAMVEPLLQHVKVRTLREERQVVPCRAGKLSAVVYANGDVSVCETHAPIGNLRQKSFPEIWSSPEATKLRRSIENRECYCSLEIAMWSSIVYQPVQLARAIAGSKMWRAPMPLPPDERADYTEKAKPLAPREQPPQPVEAAASTS